MNSQVKIIVYDNYVFFLCLSVEYEVVVKSEALLSRSRKTTVNVEAAITNNMVTLAAVPEKQNNILN